MAAIDHNFLQYSSIFRRCVAHGNALVGLSNDYKLYRMLGTEKGGNNGELSLCDY